MCACRADASPCLEERSAMKEDDQAITDHIRGAIVDPQAPFSGLPVPEPAEWDEAFSDRWVMPFYGARLNHQFQSERREAFARACLDATPTVIDRLLRTADWRERSVGMDGDGSAERAFRCRSCCEAMCFAGRADVLVLVRSGSHDADASSGTVRATSRDGPGLRPIPSVRGPDRAGRPRQRAVQGLMPLWQSWCEPNRFRTLERAQAGCEQT